MDQRRYNIKWTPCSDGKLIILELVDFATYKQEPLQGGDHGEAILRGVRG